jgi:hypothetical protein
MKAEARVLDVTSTLEGEHVKMDIDPGAMAHIMSILTDLYSDPELSVIREYSTNAYDAHIERGINRPIEVTLPAPLAPFFRVRDYGEGLDADDIREIYSRYGASTKRQSNEVVGMLGLGCKSALTYTDQFTVTGIKDGVCTQISVSRDEDGSGSMTIVAQYETNEESGVEIIVPAKKYNSFEEKSKNFFRFWKPGTVLVNGEEPRRIDGIWIADDLLLTKETDASYVVMGNVAYPHPDETSGYGHYHHKVAFVEIGAVNFTPSREALQMTAKTKQTLEALRTRFKVERDAAMHKMIEASSTHAEALEKFFECKAMGYTGPQTYKGVDIPDVFNHPTSGMWILVQGVKRYRGKSWGNYRQVSPKDSHVWLTGWTGGDFSPYRRQKLDAWMEQEGWARDQKPEHFILCDTIPQDFLPWIKPDKILSWAVIDAVKISRNKAPRLDGRPTGSYHGFTSAVSGWERIIKAEDIDPKAPIYFEQGGQWKRPRGADLIWKDEPNAYVIILGQNRIAKFCRDFPTAKRLSDAINERAKAWKDSLTEDDKLFLSYNKDYRSMATKLRMLDDTMVDDPALAAAIRLAKRNNTKLMNENKMWSTYINPLSGFKGSNPLDRYPLLTENLFYGTLSGVIKDHVYLYLNCAYAQGREVA